MNKFLNMNKKIYNLFGKMKSFAKQIQHLSRDLQTFSELLSTNYFCQKNNLSSTYIFSENCCRNTYNNVLRFFVPCRYIIIWRIYKNKD
jgi:hypothetical protein